MLKPEKMTRTHIMIMPFNKPFWAIEEIIDALLLKTMTAEGVPSI